MRRANLLAGLAFLLAVTALLLPWWSLTASLGGASGELVPPVRPWGGDGEVTHGWAVWLSTGLVALAAVLLFVRLAAASWRHEPAAFRRHVATASGLLLEACALAWLWPLEFPFWGGRTYTDNVTSEPTLVAGMPALGWWLAVAAALGCGAAAWLSRGPKASASA